MSGVTINLSKWYHGLVAALPVLALIGSFWLWLDTRYMHKEISDNRHLVLQMDVINLQLMEFNRMIDAGADLSAQQQQEFDMLKFRLQLLEKERQDSLQLGGLPE